MMVATPKMFGVLEMRRTQKKIIVRVLTYGDHGRIDDCTLGIAAWMGIQLDDDGNLRIERNGYSPQRNIQDVLDCVPTRDLDWPHGVQVYTIG